MSNYIDKFVDAMPALDALTIRKKILDIPVILIFRVNLLRNQQLRHLKAHLTLFRRGTYPILTKKWSGLFYKLIRTFVP